MMTLLTETSQQLNKERSFFFFFKKRFLAFQKKPSRKLCIKGILHAINAAPLTLGDSKYAFSVSKLLIH